MCEKTLIEPFTWKSHGRSFYQKKTHTQYISFRLHKPSNAISNFVAVTLFNKSLCFSYVSSKRNRLNRGRSRLPFMGSTAQFAFNTMINFKCNRAYNIVGSQVRKCQSNGQWSGEQPRCIPGNGWHEITLLEITYKNTVYSVQYLTSQNLRCKV